MSGNNLPIHLLFPFTSRERADPVLHPNAGAPSSETGKSQEEEADEKDEDEKEEAEGFCLIDSHLATGLTN